MSREPRPPRQQTSVDDGARAQHKHKWLRVVLSGIGTLFISWVIIYCVPRIIDVARAYNFHAPDSIVFIKKRLELTDRGTDIFYASTPAVEEKTEFNKNCQTEERSTAILGCFSKDKIYLYNLKNSELDGTLEVTAAHEMLHAAYQRLTIAEHVWLDKRIVAQYDKVKNDASMKELMAYYSKAEPGEEVNELHSILGTTLAKLDPDLENYYKRYFNNRSTVVSLNAKYNKVFTEISEKTTALETKIAAEEPDITQALATYDSDRAQLEKTIASFNSRAKASKFTSQASFDSERNALMRQVEELNARRDDINIKVSTYNADVAELTKLSTRTTALYQSMNGATQTEEVK